MSATATTLAACGHANCELVQRRTSGGVILIRACRIAEEARK